MICASENLGRLNRFCAAFLSSRSFQAARCLIEASPRKECPLSGTLASSQPVKMTAKLDFLMLGFDTLLLLRDKDWASDC